MRVKLIAYNKRDASKVLWKNDQRPIKGVVDASDLGFKPGVPPYERLYEDAADVGLVLVNPRKGTEMVFVLVEAVHESWTFDKDVVGWLFRGVSTSKKIELMVFND